MNIAFAENAFVPDLKQGGKWQTFAWGICKPLTQQDRFKVHHLVLRPGKSLDRESHFHRAEHWIVVSGSARATICGQTHEIFENQSIDIPVGQVHCLENHGKVDLHLIEIQSGTYLGEDDAQQHEDGVAA
ncbi:MAG: phosphomannose isomerase type II C-terminal cupin domain [Rhodobacterales bacterium]|jgi:mannose-6-phosphate isomerase-like protein (cupin superfamily)|nr:phosphomannose isomerase type II C-terminal cupin domain [Pseudomonadota bacterium]MDA1286204.1 phosphomannose isomerase type II C-terminal cupin domain [Pseudomonadota bacterium]HBN30175.1 hypothetical protein [Paracoccaceae bacterium]